MFRLFNRYWSLSGTLCLALEAAFLMAAAFLALRFSLGETPLSSDPVHMLLLAIGPVVVMLFFLYANGLYDTDPSYDAETRPRPGEQAVRLSRAVLAATLTLMLLAQLCPDRPQAVLALTLAIALGAPLLFGWRLLYDRLHRRMFKERVLIVGANEQALATAREVLARRHLAYDVVGFLDDDPELQGVSILNPSVIGMPGNVAALSRQHAVSRVIVADKNYLTDPYLAGLLECKTSGIHVDMASEYIERLTGKLRVDLMDFSSQVMSRGWVVAPWKLVLKDIAERTIAAIGLLLASPIMLATAIAIKLDSPGPIFYKQERVGLKGKLFEVWKFRSMTTAAESKGAPQWAAKNDSRVTRLGRYLRKFRLDEIPQLWNVLRGDMSLVGPRPERKPFVDQLTEMCPYYAWRHVVRPGVTGWAQIMAPYAATFEESIDKLEYDLYYIKNISLLLDLTIIFGTVRTVLFGRGGR